MWNATKNICSDDFRHSLRDEKMPRPLNDLLQATARSFYLALRVRPTDTIADTELVPPAQRLNALQKLRERIPGQVLLFCEFWFASAVVCF